jgi:hypothetical protein
MTGQAPIVAAIRRNRIGTGSTFATGLTIVTGLPEEHARLAGAGLEPGKLEPGDKVSLFRLRDPDRNLVVPAQAGRPS